MYSPVQIANYFLKKSFDDGVVVTPMKLIKLVYIAHGWHLAFTDEALILEAVQAWKYGPVVASVYDCYKSFGTAKIDRIVIKGDTQEIPKDSFEIELMDKIWDEYSKLDGYQLSNLTHQEGTPWDITWNHQGGKNKLGAIIPNQLIKEHYEEKMNANRRKREAAVAE